MFASKVEIINRMEEKKKTAYISHIHYSKHPQKKKKKKRVHQQSHEFSINKINYMEAIDSRMTTTTTTDGNGS
mgnify:CR=1 FL=1